MNLQAAFETPGYWQVVTGTPRRYELKSGQYGPYALGTMEDNTGAVVEMMFSGGKETALPPQSLLNVPCLWAVKYDANTQKYKALFKQYAAQGAPQQAPQSPPQRPQTPPQAAKAPNVAQTTSNEAYIQREEAKQVSIERQCAWKGACQVYSTTPPNEDMNALRAAVVDLAQAGLHFIQTGEYSPNYPPPDPSIQEDEDIPF